MQKNKHINIGRYCGDVLDLILCVVNKHVSSFCVFMSVSLALYLSRAYKMLMTIILSRHENIRIARAQFYN